MFRQFTFYILLFNQFLILQKQKFPAYIFCYYLNNNNQYYMFLFIKSLLLILLLNQVYCIQYASQIGNSISVAALVLVVPHTFFFKTHFRGLEFLQLIYLYQSIYSPSTYFSNSLQYTWMKFMPTFYNSTICNTNQFLCTEGYILSLATVLTGFLVLLSTIVLIVSCKIQNIRLIPIFSLFKGLIRWIYINLCTRTIYYIIQYCQNNISGLLTNLIGPSIVLGICILFPILQVIFTKCYEKEGIQKFNDKWVQFIEYFRILFISMLIQVYQFVNHYAQIGVYIVIVLYSIGYFFLYKFDNIGQRIIFIVTQLANIALFSLFVFAPAPTLDKDIDFYLIIIVFGFQFIYEIIKYVLLHIKKSHQVQPQTKVFNKIQNSQINILPMESIQQVDKIQITSNNNHIESKRYDEIKKDQNLTQVTSKSKDEKLYVVNSKSTIKKDNTPLTNNKKKR